MVRYHEIEKNLNRLQTKGKTLFLAQDQGLEHGPDELKGEQLNPDHIFNIAEKGEVDAFICQKGLAEKYGSSYKTNLLIKLNGKNKLGPKDDPYSPVICSVKRAVELEAKAVGFTIYVGSKHQDKIFEDFRKVQEEAHDFAMPVTAWMYPRGSTIKNDISREVLSYSSRIGLEVGADILKMKYNGNPKDMEYQVKCAGKAKMLMAGGPKAKTSKEFLKQVQEVDKAGAQGFAIGRNIWQHQKPIEMTKAIRDIQLRKKSIYEALKRFEIE